MRFLIPFPFDYFMPPKCLLPAELVQVEARKTSMNYKKPLESRPKKMWDFCHLIKDPPLKSSISHLSPDANYRYTFSAKVISGQPAAARLDSVGKCGDGIEENILTAMVLLLQKLEL